MRASDNISQHWSCAESSGDEMVVARKHRNLELAAWQKQTGTVCD